MKQKYKALAVNTMIFAIGSFGSKLISFFLVPLYTNVLSTEQYGTADFITTCANLIVPISSLVIQDAVLRFGLSGKYRAGVVCKNSFFILGIGAILTLGIIPLLEMNLLLGEWRWYIYVISVTNMISNVIYAYTRSIEKNKIYAIAGMINSFFLAMANVIFLVVFKLEVVGYLWANILAHIISIIFLLIFTNAWKDMRKEKVDYHLLKQMIAFSAPLIVNNLSWWILNSSNRIIIQIFCATEELGLFTAATKIPNLLSVVTSIFSAAWTASSIKEYETDNDKTFFANIFKMYSTVLFFGGSFILFVLKWFMKYYVGEEFYSSWRYVPFILLGTIFFSFATFYESIYQALKKSTRAAVSTVIAAIINLILTIVFIKEIGVYASCISLFVSYAVLFFIRLVDSKKFFSFEMNYKRMVVSSLTIITQAVLITIGIDEGCASIGALCILLVVNVKDLHEGIILVKNLIINRKG